MFGNIFRHDHRVTPERVLHEAAADQAGATAHELSCKERQQACQHMVQVIDGFLFPDSFFTHKTEPLPIRPDPSEQFTQNDINEVLQMPYSDYIDRMSKMSPSEQARAMRLAYVAGTMSIRSINLSRDLTNYEFRYGPDYIVFDTDNRERQAFRLSKFSDSALPMIRMNLADEGAQEHLDTLRDRGFVYVEFWGSLAIEE